MTDIGEFINIYDEDMKQKLDELHMEYEKAEAITAEATNRVGQYKCLLCSNLKYI